MEEMMAPEEPVDVVNAGEEMLVRARGTVQRIEDRIRRVMEKHSESQPQGPHRHLGE